MSRGVVTAIGLFATSAMLVVVACGDEYVESSASAPRDGTFDGACYRNNTCDDGLECLVVEGRARCRPAADGDGGESSPETGTDAPDFEASTGDAGSDAQPPLVEPGVCSFQATPFPCGSLTGEPRIACHGSDRSPRCEISACANGAIPWRCHSAAECGSNAGAKCCLASRPNVPADCSMDEVRLAAPFPATSCNSSCAQGSRQLCKTNNECGPGRTCRPIRLDSDVNPSFDDYVLGLCD